MEPEVFERLRGVILRESGISLNDDKRQLLENRLRKRLRALNLSSDQEYLNFIELDVDGRELVHLIDAISTNLTFFFRERPHFELLSEIFTDWRKQKTPRVRGWCAAASSGEEPYTLAMVASEHLDLHATDFKLLATDICTTVLEKAIAGRYELSQFRDTEPRLISKYFEEESAGRSSLFVANNALREKILFKRLNLSQFPYPLKGGLDFIFCRNVMIYFKNDLREKLIAEFTRLLRPGGYLFVGHSESLSGFKHTLTSVQSAVYQKRGAA